MQLGRWALMVAAQATTTTTTPPQVVIRIEQADWMTFAATVLGGLLALAGSVLVHRWQLAKTTRIQLLRDLLPPIESRAKEIVVQSEKSPAAVPAPYHLEDKLYQLHRTAMIAGRKDARLAVRIMRTVNDRDRLTTYEGARKAGSSEARLVRDKQIALLEQLADYQKYLMRKLRWIR
jgi:hypothetical protein